MLFIHVGKRLSGSMGISLDELTWNTSVLSYLTEEEEKG
jgi:hypothetical protein